VITHCAHRATICLHSVPEINPRRWSTWTRAVRRPGPLPGLTSRLHDAVTRWLGGTDRGQ
jgi:hypothetical protein